MNDDEQTKLRFLVDLWISKARELEAARNPIAAAAVLLCADQLRSKIG